MPTLLSLPSELRQQILSRCLPTDVHNAGPRTTGMSMGMGMKTETGLLVLSRAS